MTREEGVYVAFGQYWLQARHQETARLWMTNIIAIVFGALLAFYRLFLWPREREAAEEQISSTKRLRDRKKSATASEPVD